MPSIPALRKPRQAAIYEFKASLAYIVSSRTAKTTKRNSVSKTQQTGLERWLSG